MSIRRVPFGLLVLYLLFSVAAYAQEGVEILPPNPTTATEVTLHVTLECGVGQEYTITRSGSVITIQYGVPNICDPPLSDAQPVPLGLLEAGEYRVIVIVGSQEYGRTQFVVREATPSPPFEIRPSTLPPFRSTPIRITPSPCAGDACDSLTVTIGDAVLSPDQFSVDAAGLSVLAPGHDPGLVDIIIGAGNEQIVLENALAYYSDTVPDLSLFERVLYPVVSEGPGEHGSLWTSEAFVSNPGPWVVQLFDDLSARNDERLLPAADRRIQTIFPNGVYLWVPRSEADLLTYSLRIRDVSREAETLGTEIPVIRESAMYAPQTTMTLLDVPIDARYRSRLRIYAYPRASGNSGMHARVVTVNPHSGVRTTRGVTMTERCTGPSCRFPAYADLELVTGAPGEHVNVYVSVDPEGKRAGPAWSFVSVTNNTTQQVTIVTPDGDGGEACAACEIP